MPHDRPQPLRDAWEQALRRDPEISGSTLLVLLVMATYGNRDGRGIAVSVARLASDVGLGERQVKRALGNGRERGWLRQERRGNRAGDGSTVASLHELTIPPVGVASDTSSARSTCHPSHLEIVSTGHQHRVEVSPVSALGVTRDTRPVVTRSTRGRRVEIDACTLCDGNGWREIGEDRRPMRCDHRRGTA